MNEELETVPVTGPDGKVWNVKVPRGTSEDEVKAYVLRKKYGTTVAPVEKEVVPEPEPAVAETEEVAAEPEAEPKRRFTGAGIGLTPGGSMIAEPVLSMLTGVTSLIPSWLRAGYGLATGETDPEAAAAMRRTQREMTYQPRTELGKAGLQTIAPVAEVLSIPSELIGTGVEKLTDSKVLGGIAEDVLGPEVLIPGVAGVKGLRKAKVADEIPTAPEVPKPVAEATVEQVVDTPKDLVQPPAGEMGPPKTGIVKSPDEVRAEIDEAKDVIEPSADLEETRLSAVGIPENLIADVKTVIGPEADIRVAPTVALQKEIVSAAKELLTEGQVRIDPSIPPMMQVANLLQSGRLAPDRYVEILKQNNLTPDDFSRFYIEEVSQAGRTLQTLSGFRKFSQAADLDAQIADVRAKIDQGTATPEDMQILDSLENQKNALEAINTSRAGGIIDDRGILKRIEDMRRGLMVSQLVTAVRNGTAGVGRSILDTGTRIIDFGIQKATGRINPELPLQTAGDALGQVYALLNPKQSIDLTKQILSVRPKEYDELFRQYNAGVALGGKDSTILGQAEKGVYALNLFNRLQDSVFRSAVFADSIERGMKARNLDLKEIMASGRMGDIPEDLIQRGVQDAMEFTFSAKPKTRGEKAIVDAFENLPLGTVAVPFPRFMINSFRFMTEYSPLGPLHLLSKKERAAIAKGDTRLLSKTLAGSALLYGAYALRDSEYAGEKWYELKGPDGKTIDMRPYAPFSAYLFVGDLIKRNQDQTLYELDKRDISEAVLGVSTDRTGMQFVDELLKAAREDPETGKRGVQEVMERFAGEYAGTFFIPFQQARDVFAQFNEEEAKVRRVKDVPLTGPIETKIPFVSQDLPESFSYVNPQTRVRESPLMRQVTGVTMISPKNEAEKELDRLQIKEFQIFKRTGNSDADRLIASKTAPVVQEKVSQIVSGERYQKFDNDQKRLILRKVMSEAYNEAKMEAIKERPELFIEDAVRKALSKDELRILEKRGFKIPKAEETSEKNKSYTWDEITPEMKQKAARVFKSLGLYETGGLDRISFDRLPLEKRKRFFEVLTMARGGPVRYSPREEALLRKYANGGAVTNPTVPSEEPEGEEKGRVARFLEAAANELPSAMLENVRGYSDLASKYLTWKFGGMPVEDQVAFARSLPSALRQAAVNAIQSAKELPEKIRTATPESAGEFTGRVLAGELTDPMRVGRAARAVTKPVMSELDVYHGSPHRFEEFDASKIGTGEGAQVYGHGLYFAENPDVAMSYKNALEAGRGDRDIDVMARVLQSTNNDPIAAAAELRSRAKTSMIPERTSAFLEMADKLEKGFNPFGAVYKADLPDEMVDRMLDWDKPLSQQSTHVKKSLKNLGIDSEGLALSSGADLIRKDLPLLFGQKMRAAGFNPNKSSDVSAFLKSQGIPGIKYADAGSRGQGGSGTRNFVVFPGEEKKVKILKRD